MRGRGEREEEARKKVEKKAGTKSRHFHITIDDWKKSATRPSKAGERKGYQHDEKQPLVPTAK